MPQLEFVATQAGGSVLSGPARTAEHPARELVAVPLYPGANIVPPAVVPEPPYVSPDADDATCFRLGVNAFRVVHEHTTGASWYRPPGVLAKDRAAVTAGVVALRAAGIRPLRWVQWSFGVWREVAKKPGPPPLRWVFLASRIREHEGWYEGAWGSYRSGRIVLGPVHRDLLNRHTQMTSAMRRGTRPAEAIAHYFPGDTYAQLVDAARKEASATQRELNRRVHAGELLD